MKKIVVTRKRCHRRSDMAKKFALEELSEVFHDTENTEDKM